MKYLELIKESNEELQERYCLAAARVKEIAADASETGRYADYFQKTAAFLCLLYQIVEYAQKDELRFLDIESAEMMHAQLYADICGEAYETSYANPTYAAAQFGKEAGQLLTALYARIRGCRLCAFEGNLQNICIFSELFIEYYGYFSETEAELRFVKEALYSFMHDYSEIFNEEQIVRLMNSDYDYYLDIVMQEDLEDSSYLYRYGLFVGENELGSARFLNTFREQEIQAMADIYTEGYRMGFVSMRKDLSIKTTVEIRYPIGFERMVRAAVKNFAKLNLRCVMKPYSTSPNQQYDYDHMEDQALWMDKAYVERSLEVYRTVLEKYKTICRGYAGPAVIEVFGEKPFSPQIKEANIRLNEKQQQLSIYQKSEFGQMLNRAIHAEERSFTIIAYPIPKIGEQYEEIFAETVKLNTLDSIHYRKMQQKLIDVLDQGEQVHVKGANGNQTDLYVSIYPLEHPQKETAFENCVADVNIPVGEVFTTPVLKGTTGKLHVSQVYLNGYNFLNLEIDFVDGMITGYTCTNFEKEQDNRAYILEHLLYHHETLAMGEFAIGTNTTAYKMARKYEIADKLPILIAEKTGPHFAVGDTCYSYDEDNMTYNADGKAIVARDNVVSIQRKTDISKAYYNCHTDITIPYDELGCIKVIKKDGTSEAVICNGRFVVPGTEELNIPLDAIEL